MKKKSVKRIAAAFILALALAMSLALVGCSSGSGGSSGSSGSGSSSTPATSGGSTSGSNSGSSSGSGSSSSAATEIAKEWQGSWFSVSEILPPEEATDKYEIIVSADGSFVLNENDKQVYTGTLVITNVPDTNWGEATINGKTIKVQLVNAQGIYKFIFNAGDDWNKDLKKIIFQR